MKRVLVALAVVAVAAVGGAVVYQAAERERDYRELLASGDAALAADETFAAIEDYSGAIALHPDSMLAHLRRAETYRQRGDLEAAARDFRTAAALDPTATRPLEEWGDILYQQRRYERAVEVYDARLRLDDRSAPIRYKVGLTYYRAGNLDAALPALERAIELDARLADAHYLRGLCLRDRGQLQDAAAAVERAAAIAPSMVAAHEELASLYASLGRSADELAQLELLAGLETPRAERRIAVALAQARAGHTERAVLTLSTALEQTSNPPLVYGALGRLWLDVAVARRDRPDAIGKALEALERAASSSTATSEVKALYGRALLLDRQMEAAEQVLRQATERDPVAPAAFADYATAAEGLRHLPEARAALITFNALVGDDPGFADRAKRIGLLSLAIDDAPAAILWLQRALVMTPSDVSALAALTDAQLRSGDRESAAATAARGLNIDPQNPQLRTLARRIRARLSTLPR